MTGSTLRKRPLVPHGITLGLTAFAVTSLTLVLYLVQASAGAV